MSYWGDGESTRRREAKGGIKLQGKRKERDSWWAERWLEVLESYNLGGRLARGRTYARAGQVLSLEVGIAAAEARVQGSRRDPYTVTLKMKPLTAKQWETILDALAGQALFAARLLAGEIPHEIETVFTKEGLSLFPTKQSDLTTDCSCPDYSNPCKHTAAVYYILGEAFDRDPFLIFALRGLAREEVSARLMGPQSQAEPTAPPPDPLSADLSLFWDGSPDVEVTYGEVRKPPVSAALVKRLGDFPFWRAATPLCEAIEPIYTRASPQGLNAFLGESS